MKNLKLLYSLLVVLGAGLFASCTNDNAYAPGAVPEGPQVSFLMNNPTSIEFSGVEGEEVQRLTLSRYNTDGDILVYILADMPKEDMPLFDIPEFVEFKAGESTAELVMTINHAKFQNDTTYTVGFYIDETMTTPYGCAEWTVTFALNPWELMTDDKGNPAKGKFRGGAALDYIFNINTDLEIDVDIYKHKSKPGVYKIADPWTPAIAYGFGYPSIEEALADGLSTTNAGLVFDASNPDAVIIEEQSMGIDIGYGEMLVFTGYPLYVTDPAAGAGSLVDGVITFPAKTGLLFYSQGINEVLGKNANTILNANISGSFRIIMPGVEMANYSLTVVYDGMDVAADNKKTAAKLKFTYGDDVTGIKYLVVKGNVEENPAEALATILAGTDENILSVENFQQGGKEANLKVGLETGLYTVVAVPVDKAGALRAKEAYAKSFYFPGLGATEEHPCEIGVLAAKFSLAYPEYAPYYPDTTSMAFCIYGTDIKDVKFIYLPTAQLEGILAQGAALEDVIAGNNFNDGQDYDVDLTQVNGANGWVSNAISLKAGTEYTVAVLGTNVYGESAVATTTHTTDSLPEYTGELVIGDYSMYCKYAYGEGADEVVESSCVFNVACKGESETEFVVTNFGIESSFAWNAKYDSAAGTLTLDGTMQGYEENGNLFGDYYFYYNKSNGTVFGLFSFNSEDSQGLDPIVLTVDPATKQISGLATMEVDVAVRRLSDGGYDYLALFFGGLTEIAPYVEAQKQSTPALAKVPFSSLKINKKLVAPSLNKVKVEKSADVMTSVNLVKKESRTVKPSVVETYTSEKTKGLKLAKVNEVAFRR